MFKFGYRNIQHQEMVESKIKAFSPSSRLLLAFYFETKETPMYSEYVVVIDNVIPSVHIELILCRVLEYCTEARVIFRSER